MPSDPVRKMPILFVGHGSPMNAIEDNPFTRSWQAVANQLAATKPKAIVMISAHWFTSGTKVMGNEQPRMIYDMYGFPRELCEVIYPAPGAPELAETVKNLLTKPMTFAQVARLSVPTTDHFDPLLYILGAADEKEKITIFNEACFAGSLSMTSYLFGV